MSYGADKPLIDGHTHIHRRVATFMQNTHANTLKVKNQKL